MYDQFRLSELIRFARVKAGSAVIDVYPGDGDWTSLFSDIVGPEGRVYSFVPAEVAHFKNDPVGRMRTLAKEPGRENVETDRRDGGAAPRIRELRVRDAIARPAPSPAGISQYEGRRSRHELALADCPRVS